jgi:non-heme Fe2+,alpha-ketoglutarate-dependent halogenase
MQATAQTIDTATRTATKTFFFTPEELADFHAKGVAGPFTLFEPEEMKEHWRRERLQLFDRSKATYPDAPPGSGVFDYDRHLDNSFLADVVARPEVAHRMASILGPDVLCWRTEFFVKYPGDEGTDWHQADNFGGANGIPHIRWPNGSDFNGTLTAWIAFTEADEETACMRFIPGTQRTLYYDESKGMHYEPEKNNQRIINGEVRGFFGYDWRELKVDPNWEPDESKSFSVPCRAGQFLIFWSTTMHASYPHLGKSKDYRLAFAPRYVPTSVKIYEAMKDANRVDEFGGSFSLDKYGSVVVSGRNDYPEHRIATHTTRGKPFINSNPR